MKIAVVKYNAGNIQSLGFALNRLGVDPIITDDVSELQSADKVIFPGQGEASTAMRYLRDKKLDRVLKNLQQPFLGVCLGMQLMCEHTEENDTDCLGILPLRVRRFSHDLKVPHMGWNTIGEVAQDDLMKDVKNGEYLYFVHSYFVEKSEYSTALTEYGIEFSAAVRFKNYFAIQPHPEKSADTGMHILKNFLSI